MEKKFSLGAMIYDRAKRRSLVALAVYLGLMIIAAVVFARYVDRDSLQAIVSSSGKLGVVAYFLIEVVYVTFTPLINSVILITSGYIFGGPGGFVMNFLANIVGSLLIVFLVQQYGRPLLQRVVSPHLYKKFDQITQKVGPMTLMVVYALPLTPDDELTYLVAAGPIGPRRLILPILIGTLGKAAYSYIGDAGSRGLAIALYARLATLIVGVTLVGLQEHIFKKLKV
ncbi:TVP38/TMEM64 family protein [Patescibacteria group bacterium]|nr:MAG: TVP38/TMEM64 family protein [Patescibacteria group bacterium]